jgi:hypothetical protein
VSFWLQALLVAAAYAALNFVWPRYIAAISARRPGAAAGWDMALICISSVATVVYVHEPWLIAVAIAAGGAGCYASVRSVTE